MDALVRPQCRGFHLGCTCGSCMDRYFRQYANSCTYGASPIDIDAEWADFCEQSLCTCSIMFTAGKKTVARNPECFVHREAS